MNRILYRQLTSEATVLAYDVAEERLKHLLSNNPDKNTLFSYMKDLLSAYVELNKPQKDKKRLVYRRLMQEAQSLRDEIAEEKYVSIEKKDIDN